MILRVDRFVSDDDSTISTVWVNDKFVCFGLEDEYRAEKIAAETRIPAGRYPVRLRVEGGFHKRYSQRFRSIHRGMLHVKHVPGFEWILIHVGNTDEDTAGCLLVGTGAMTQPGSMSIQASVDAYRRLYPMVVDAAADGELEAVYRDLDRP